MAMFHEREWPCCGKLRGKCKYESWSSYFAQRTFIGILGIVPRRFGFWLIDMRFRRSTK
jgi:hypothetical protein